MKEVKFRWIDQYLIHMTLKTKFAILALVPMFMIVGLAVFLNTQFRDTLLGSKTLPRKSINSPRRFLASYPSKNAKIYLIS